MASGTHKSCACVQDVDTRLSLTIASVSGLLRHHGTVSLCFLHQRCLVLSALSFCSNFPTTLSVYLTEPTLFFFGEQSEEAECRRSEQNLTCVMQERKRKASSQGQGRMYVAKDDSAAAAFSQGRSLQRLQEVPLGQRAPSSSGRGTTVTARWVLMHLMLLCAVIFVSKILTCCRC